MFELTNNQIRLRHTWFKCVWLVYFCWVNV